MRITWLRTFYSVMRLAVPLLIVSQLANANDVRDNPAEAWVYWEKSSLTNWKDLEHSPWDYFLRKYVVTDHPSGV
ncbi:MAG: hypothetical protein ACWA5K_09325, partial [bacterium]